MKNNLKNDLTAYLLLALVSIVWGGTFIAGRVISPEIDGLLLATLRFVIATLCLLFILFLTKTKWYKPTKKQGTVLLLLGLFGIFFYNLFFFEGLKLTQASRAAFIVACNPAMIALLSALTLKKWPSLKQFVGILFCLGGAFSIILSRSDISTPSSSSASLGDLLIAGCVLSWGIYTVFAKPVIQSIGALLTVAYSVFIGTILLLVSSLIMGRIDILIHTTFSQIDIASLLYLGIFGSALAYYFYYAGIKQIGATRAGVFIALNPITAGILGYFLLNEALSSLTLISGLLILFGIFLVNREK